MSIPRVALLVMLTTGAAGFFATPIATEARRGGEISIQIAPPPIPYETLPSPKRGYVWVNGDWNWRHHRHGWVLGT